MEDGIGAHAPLDEFRLPVGYVDPAGTLHATMRIREMTGRERDLLMARSVPWFNKLVQLIKNCTVAVGEIEEGKALVEAIKGLTNHDRLVALLRIRALTHGGRYDFTIRCPECKREVKRFVDLAEVRVSPVSDGRRSFDVPLTDARGNVVSTAVWTFLGWDAENALSYLGKDESEEDKSVDMRRGTIALWARLVRLGDRAFSRRFEVDGTGVPIVPKDELAAVEGLSMRHGNAIWQSIRKVEDILVDLDVPFTCPNQRCKHAEKMPIDVAQPGFFYPEAPEI